MKNKSCLQSNLQSPSAADQQGGYKIKFILLTSSQMLQLVVGFFIFIACAKEGPGGKASIKGTVKHHTAPVPGSTVYIKYGAKESPGTDITYYDASIVTDANANYEFIDLRKGDYYLFGIGYDSSISKIVTGGIPVTIKSKNEAAQSDVQVTE